MNPSHHPQSALFEPLIAALTAGRYLRVVARPGWVTGDPPFGPCLPLPDTSWSAESHAEALAACQKPVVLADGITAVASGDGVVVSWVPRAFLPADLVREQVISPLAMRFLSGALAVGRNILVAGSYNAALPLLYALVGEGARPAWLGAEYVPTPQRWLRLRHTGDVGLVHADRVGVCGVPSPLVVGAMGSLCGVVAYSASRRLDQALMRYELGAAAAADARNAPLHVLAGVDLVVQVGVHGACHVMQIVEIALTEAGYRPHILFSAGLPPTPQALMPHAAPSFLQELALAGHAGLAEELSQFAPAAGARAPHTSMQNTPPPPPAATSRPPERAPAAMPPRASRPPPRPWPGPKAVAKHADTSPPDSLPGWELDRLPAPEAEVGMIGVASADDAVLAATYGLAPPPRPGGARGPRPLDDSAMRPQSVDVDDLEDEALPYLPPDDGGDEDGNDPPLEKK